MDVVPCIRLPGLPDERRPAYIAADNRPAGHTGRDQDLLRPGTRTSSGPARGNCATPGLGWTYPDRCRDAGG